MMADFLWDLTVVVVAFVLSMAAVVTVLCCVALGKEALSHIKYERRGENRSLKVGRLHLCYGWAGNMCSPMLRLDPQRGLPGLWTVHILTGGRKKALHETIIYIRLGQVVDHEQRRAWAVDLWSKHIDVLVWRFFHKHEHYLVSGSDSLDSNYSHRVYKCGPVQYETIASEGQGSTYDLRVWGHRVNSGID